MVKEFLYRGIPKEELDSLSLEKLFCYLIPDKDDHSPEGSQMEKEN